METYCISCLQHKTEKQFSLWLNDKSKARRCNGCHNDDQVKQRMRKADAERAAKPAPVSPILVNLSQTLESHHKRDVQHDLSKQAECRRLMKEMDISREEALEIIDDIY